MKKPGPNGPGFLVAAMLGGLLADLHHFVDRAIVPAHQ